jgi:hypothetical protein
MGKKTATPAAEEPLSLRDDLDRRIYEISEQKRQALASTQVEALSSTLGVFERVSPHLAKPTWLKPFVTALDDAILKGDVKLCFSAPVQHGKSTVIAHALIFAALVRPGKHHAYSTYSDSRATDVMLEVKRLAEHAGLTPHSRHNVLTLANGTSIRFVGMGGSLTGAPVSGLHVVDDPLKNRAEANSKLIRDRIYEWFFDVGETRRHPGSSVIVMMSRWHLDDLIGRLTAQEKWRYLRIPAICDSNDDPLGRQIGEALWPAQRSLKWLEPFKRREVTWQSLYQGQPRAIGDTLFNAATYWEGDLPSLPYTPVYGADLAYTAKTRADHSVLLHGRWYPALGKLYLINCLRAQVQADKFTDMMGAHWRLEPGRVWWFGNTVEKGAAQLIKRLIPRFEHHLASEDKYVRALPTAEQLWNQQHILVPKGASWTEAFVDEVIDFTGVSDAEDDQVDALAAIGALCLAMWPPGSGDFNRLLLDRLRARAREDIN